MTSQWYFGNNLSVILYLIIRKTKQDVEDALKNTFGDCLVERIKYTDNEYVLVNVQYGFKSFVKDKSVGIYKILLDNKFIRNNNLEFFKQPSIDLTNRLDDKNLTKTEHVIMKLCQMNGLHLSYDETMYEGPSMGCGTMLDIAGVRNVILTFDIYDS